MYRIMVTSDSGAVMVDLTVEHMEFGAFETKLSEAINAGVAEEHRLERERPPLPTNFDWYSICSAHRDYMKGCGNCATGRWEYRPLIEFQHFIYERNYRLWHKWANRADSPDKQWLERIFPNLWKASAEGKLVARVYKLIEDATGDMTPEQFDDAMRKIKAIAERGGGRKEEVAQ